MLQKSGSKREAWAVEQSQTVPAHPVKQLGVIAATAKIIWDLKQH